eukprot:859470-Rhodomonas_salina.2
MRCGWCEVIAERRRGQRVHEGRGAARTKQAWNTEHHTSYSTTDTRQHASTTKHQTLNYTHLSSGFSKTLSPSSESPARTAHSQLRASRCAGAGRAFPNLER